MTPVDMLLFVADGLRAGTLQALPLGTASVRALEPSWIKIDDFCNPSTVIPKDFNFQCDLTITRTKEE